MPSYFLDNTACSFCLFESNPEILNHALMFLLCKSKTIISPSFVPIMPGNYRCSHFPIPVGCPDSGFIMGKARQHFACRCASFLTLWAASFHFAFSLSMIRQDLNVGLYPLSSSLSLSKHLIDMRKLISSWVADVPEIVAVEFKYSVSALCF